MFRAFVPLVICASVLASGSMRPAQAAEPEQGKPADTGSWCSNVDGNRTVCADVVALDQALIYNRFGSFNPYGMIFALRRDIVPVSVSPARYDADACGDTDGTETHSGEGLEAGRVRLKDCRRPRPMVLRANAGDVLQLRIQNLLRPEQPSLSGTFCRQPRATPPLQGVWEAFGALRSWVSEGSEDQVRHGEADCLAEKVERDEQAAGVDKDEADWPRTRRLAFAIQGLTALPAEAGKEADPRCLGLKGIEPNETILCAYKVDTEGTYFLSSTAAPSGGEGDGGSITHGLFGAVIGEPTGSAWYRSQMTQKAFRTLWGSRPSPRHAVEDMTRTHEALARRNGAGGVPILGMVRELGANGPYEIVHTDLNAIVHRNPGAAEGQDDGRPESFREFSVFFHDELKTFYTRNFSELGKFGEGQLAGVRDGFAINYGASGMGASLLANRKGIGPSANCAECLYEEFFLTSWANGDPALLEQYSDDPSNVHHSYLNDAVVFRNFHAGPKETHVFHLHAHQWFSGNDSNRGAYLDSQTVAPQQGFTYDIYGGGLQIYRRGTEGEKGWYETLGAGNRNRTVGDSIFHCHLYPHFAQGMWELWRVHDVLEDGTRKLPDGQWEAGLSLAEMSEATRARKRPGSVTSNGRWIGPSDGAPDYTVGTPVPALVPLPGQAWPLLPTYSGETTLADLQDAGEAQPEAGEMAAVPGYPFYIGGKPGHRPSQAPLDIAKATGSEGVLPGDYLDGGLPRHIVKDGAERTPGVSVPDGFLDPHAPEDVTDLASALDNSELSKREARQTQLVAKMLALGDLTMHIEKAELDLLPYDGTALEKAAMAFHHDGRGLDLRLADGSAAQYFAERGGYARAVTDPELFVVNGGKAKPGAPFADPCAAPDSYAVLERRGADDYTYQELPVYFAEAGGGDIPTAGPHRAARDADVSNWVKWYRSDANVAKRPVLYYVDGEDGVQTIDTADAVTFSERDPFTGEDGMTADPAVVGFRRYEASAVQLDLVTNRAGWHDPQARINVLTAQSPVYKKGKGLISPRVSADEQPFFFRALSGECIEFRHTNELPKELELDDFQVRTPTDTIGQHIHLVKFDVTSSDGSANGFNYEDGTLAPDEIAARICAAKNGGMPTEADRAAGALRLREFEGLCENTAGEGETPHWQVAGRFEDRIWQLRINEGTCGGDTPCSEARQNYRNLFQTTTQRWFADPILSPVRLAGDGRDGDAVDRTLRTVFSHDHFGPSSIQQHGFYTALLIEPQGSQTCETDAASCTSPRVDRALIDGKPIDVGTQKIIVDFDSLDEVSSREFALAVADFATLYDPRDTIREAELLAAFPDRSGDGDVAAEAEEPSLAKGMATLYCEAKYARASQPGNMNRYCGSGLSKDGDGTVFSEPGDVSPAWLAAAMPKDRPDHSGDLLSGFITAKDVEDLKEHLITYRRKAAGNGDGGALANPVAAAKRPESISVDHHDPYLLNYRGEPLPLRIGTDHSDSDDCALADDPADWVAKLEAGVSARCSITRQKSGPAGDLANVFLSSHHRDPATPIMRTQTGDKVQFRLIQGAQEVQHTFILEGYNWTRNLDQRFPTAMVPLDDTTPRETLAQACDDMLFRIGPDSVELAKTGRADQYYRWLRGGLNAVAADFQYWKAYEDVLAACFNREGRITAQEVGISEHFEFSGTYRNDYNLERLAPQVAALSAADLPSDTLQHFGSQDSLWNGAWSLLRTYPQGSDELAALSRAENAARQARSAVGDSARSRLSTAALEASQALLRVNAQASACRLEAPLVHAAVVAIEAETVFGRTAATGDVGTPYGSGLYDRNGLFLAQVDPLDVANAAPEGVAVHDFLRTPDAWKGIRLRKVVDAIRKHYERPEPLVLPVNAGDCVTLTVINALRIFPGTQGLKDDLGDARMPAIVPLNTEPQWGLQDEDGPNSRWTFRQEGGINVRPSARFALMLPLPTFNYTNSIARPFGINATGALAGLAAGADTLSMVDDEARPEDRQGQIEQMTFYAGRAAAAANANLSTVAMGGRYYPRFREALNGLLAGVLERRRIENIRAEPIGSQAEAEPHALEFAGRRYRLQLAFDDASSGTLGELLDEDPGASEAVARLWDTYANAHVGEKVHFVPYAFGALPIKSMGDVIGHPTHGLVGAVNVLPAGSVVEEGRDEAPVATRDAARDLCVTGSLYDRGRDCAVFVARPVTGADGRVRPFGELRIETADPSGGRHAIREFTLFWQDGLNLRNRATKDVFVARGGTRPRLVSDCLVCDDTYDFGDQGVSYRSEPFHIRLRGERENAGLPQPERHSDLNAYVFPSDFFALKQGEITGPRAVPVLRVAAEEEVVLHVVHPGGRARQHAFATIGQNYNDLFPGFGFPRSALVAPGKTVTASFTRRMAPGCYPFFDGPPSLWAGGLWGLIDVVAAKDLGDRSKTFCARR